MIGATLGGAIKLRFRTLNWNSSARLVVCSNMGRPALSLRAARGSAARYADTAVPNKNHFDGVGGLRTYISSTRIGDQPSR
jgi:hypothetical protein